jgi:DNA-binding NtrC family response regulator
MEILSRHTWPGNVRELENAIEHAVAVCTNHVVRAGDLPEYIVAQAPPATPLPARGHPLSLADDRPSLDELCRRYTHLVLAEADGNKSRAAEVLGINRRTLYRYLEAGGEPPRADEAAAGPDHGGPAEDAVRRAEG